MRNNVRIQLGYVQEDLEIRDFDLQAWWDEWFDAYMAVIERTAQTWAENAIIRVNNAFVDARDHAIANNRPVAANTDTVQAQLMAWTINRRWLDMKTPPSNNFRPPSPPGGAGGGGT